MYFPAIFALVQDDHFTSRSFFYSATLFLFLAVLVGFALGNVRPRLDARNQLLALLASFALLPVMLAVPFYEAVRDTSFVNAYFEMVSSLTTTGATIFEDPDRLADPVHFWRAIVGWLGGFLAWVMAAAILAPMNLGGFEVASSRTAGQGATRFSQLGAHATASERVARFSSKLLPIYSALTLILWIGLILVGDTPFVAICHAMSTLATSGISPLAGLEEANGGWAGEALIAVFFVFALSRHTFMPAQASHQVHRLRQDRELRVGLFFALTIPTLLFLRHWVGAYEVDEQEKIYSVIQALWGSVFTVFSFLSTTGFESKGWTMASDWSGLRTPGVILMGLALIGGGVATTAGGVKPP